VLYLSQLINAPVRDREGERIATVRDVLVRIGEGYPPVTGVVARQGRRLFFLKINRVASIAAEGLVLASPKLNLEPFVRRDGEILLAKDALDRQLIDVDGKRVVRVNDVQIALVEGQYRVIGVDVGARALLARLGFRRSQNRPALGNLLDWKNIEYLAANAPNVRLNVSHDRLAQLHPAEIANIIEELSYHEGAEIVSALDDETAADTIEELDDDRQAEIIEGLDSERAADILEEMAPDDAADILADLPQERQDELLALMEREESDDVRELLEYEGDTAGGLMTTDYFAVPPTLTAAEALAQFRATPPDDQPDMVYYFYVVDHAPRAEEAAYTPGDDVPEYLRGVVTLRGLVLAPPDTLVSDLMERDVIVAAVTDRADDAARQIIEYGLYALPVVAQGNELRGIITVDDAMERLLPDSWRERLKVFS